MLQAIIKKGKVKAEEIPAPSVEYGTILIKVVNSCISIGTELKSVETSKKSLIRQSLENPDKLKKLVDKILKHDYKGVYHKVIQLNKKNAITMEAGQTLGYSLSGIVLAVGEGVTNFKPGDFVAAAGAGKAHHAEYVEVPTNLVVRIPDKVSFENASTVAIGSIALQGIRRAGLQVGEYCVVYGAGFIGLITLQILIKSGIRTIAVDIDKDRLQIAKEIGAELVINVLEESEIDRVLNYTGGNGADAVIFTASTQDDSSLSSALKMLRLKGKFVLVGIAGNKLKREDLYHKEIDFLISTSYGPGRYDVNYEEKGQDYPYGYVRWTENRNMAEYLRLVQSGVVSFNLFERSVFSISEIAHAFSKLQNSSKKASIVFIAYQDTDILTLNANPRIEEVNSSITFHKAAKKDIITIGYVGIGNFSLSTHLPNIQKLSDKFTIKGIMNRSGHKAKYVMDKFGASYCTTNYNDILTDPDVDIVMICNNHKSHGDFVLKGLQAGKNVFVEKPLAVNNSELEPIKSFYSDGIKDKPLLMVGFNRRFSPYIQQIKEFTSKRINPLIINYRINAGQLSSDHWIYSEGGRIIGEACHIFDLFSYLTDSKLITVNYETISSKNGYYFNNENIIITLKYEDGSLCTLAYFATGSRDLSKEYMEVHFDGKSFVLDDYKLLKGYGMRCKVMKTVKNEKGHKEELVQLYNFLHGDIKHWPIPFISLIETTELTFEIN